MKPPEFVELISVNWICPNRPDTNGNWCAYFSGVIGWSFQFKLFSTTLNLNVCLCFNNFIWYMMLCLYFAGNSKLIHLLHNSEHPTSVFSILDTGTKQIPLVADSLFDLLILKMQPAYSSKKQTKVRTLSLKVLNYILSSLSFPF